MPSYAWSYLQKVMYKLNANNALAKSREFIVYSDKKVLEIDSDGTF